MPPPAALIESGQRGDQGSNHIELAGACKGDERSQNQKRKRGAEKAFRRKRRYWRTCGGGAHGGFLILALGGAAYWPHAQEPAKQLLSKALRRLRGHSRGRLRDFSREVRDWKNCDFTERDTLRTINARELLHFDAKRLDHDGTIRNGVADFARRVHGQEAVLCARELLSDMPTQLDDRISIRGNRREVPQTRCEPRDVILEPVLVAIWWWKQQRPAIFVRKNSRGEMNLFGRSLLARLG